MFESWSLFSFYTIVNTIFSFLTFLLFIIRFIIFYKKGLTAAKTTLDIPTFPEVHTVFFILGIAAPWFFILIPFSTFLVLICTVIALIKSYKMMHPTFAPAEYKPETIALLGLGMGLSGIAGYVLGFYRGKNE